MPKKILIVDDEPHLLIVTAVTLETSGYEVLQADSGERALEVLKNNKPDLILLDLLLPGLQGDAICRQLKSDTEFKHIPIVLFTARSAHIVETVSEIGADDFIIKPFKAEDLIFKIKKFIG